MKKWIPMLLLLLLCGCAGGGEADTAPETTEPYSMENTTLPTTVPPTTIPPTTLPPTPSPPTEEPAPDENWFDDALFIGESRTAGLRAYGRLGDADYFCGEGLTVYGALGVEASDLHFGEQSLQSLFSRKQYGKIYIHLGINELGGNLDSFVKQYQKVIDSIRQMQPEARIILQSVLSLEDRYSSKACFRAESIQDINSRIRALAEKNGLYFSDVNKIMTDETGYLIEGLSFDGCHLYPENYELWAQWLLEEAPEIEMMCEEENE